MKAFWETIEEQAQELAEADIAFDHAIDLATLFATELNKVADFEVCRAIRKGRALETYQAAHALAVERAWFRP